MSQATWVSPELDSIDIDGFINGISFPFSRFNFVPPFPFSCGGMEEVRTAEGGKRERRKDPPGNTTDP